MVSVIIPNFNHEKYLQKRIESILNQTFQDFEIIILDDCSTDNSRNIIEKYRNHDKVTHIVYNIINSGSTFKQWVKGFDLVNRKYIWIAESDDLIELDFLEVALSKLNNEINVFCSNAELIDENNNVIMNSYHHECYVSIPENEFKVWEGIEFVKRNMLLFNTICNASGVIFEKKLLENVTGNYKRYKLTGDWLFWAQIVKDTGLILSRNGYNKFRCHSNNVRSSVKEELMVDETYSVLSYLFQILKIRNKSELYQKVFDHFMHTLNNRNVINLKVLIKYDKGIIYRVLKFRFNEFYVNNSLYHLFRKVMFFIKAFKNKILI